MNKKGFTLVELIVSITLISIVLVSMTATLISLRTAYSRAYEDSDVLVYSSSISRVLNNDFTNNNGIRSISCNLIGTRCDITFGNNERRQLKIVEVPDSSPQSVIDQRGYRKQRTTLQYIDKNTNEILYIKTSRARCFWIFSILFLRILRNR
jgi:prepilin-type N-terminal cleavage/methylation domain-containing protein